MIKNEILLNAIGIIFIIFASKAVYTKADSIIKIIISVVEAVIVFLVLTREDQRGLHDLMFGTKVISTEVPKQEETKVIEAIVEESTEPVENKKKVNQTKEKNTKNKVSKKTK